MKPIFQQAIIQATRRKKSSVRLPENESGPKEQKIILSHFFKDALLIGLGIFSAGFALQSFLLPNSFIDGGVTGISLLVNKLSAFPLSILILLINIPFVVLGFTQIGKAFAVKSIIAISGLAIVLATVNYPVITTDRILIGFFGGFFLGAGVGLAIRGGAVLDGTEVLAIYLSKRTTLTIGDIILALNIVIFSVAAWLLSMEIALFSIIIYLVASKTVDFIIEGVEEYTGVTIISVASERIRLMIINQLGRGVTLYAGKGGYGKRGDNLNTIDIVYTVITRLEIGRLQAEVEKIDPEAFMVMSSIKDTKGGMIKKRPLH